MEDHAFATLTPTNVVARLAFSEVFDAFTAGRQNIVEDGVPTCRRMFTGPQQEYDGDVLRLKLEVARLAQEDPPGEGETSESLTEPGTDTELELRAHGMIWSGHYSLDFELPPSTPELGWTMGKAPLDKNIPGVDLVLCTRSFAKKYGISLRNMHARFNFAPENRAFFVAGCSRSRLTQLTVNGETVQRRLFALNQHTMKITADKLEYTFQYTAFADTAAFRMERSGYLTGAMGAPALVDFEVPTPLHDTRTIGQWTLGEPLGRGGHGRVFLATNLKNEVAAVKLVERTRKTAEAVDAEVAIYNQVTELAERWDAGERIVRQTEVLYSKGEVFSSKVAFDDGAMVLQPMTPRTFSDLVGAGNSGRSKGMSMAAADAFRDALQAVAIMHSHDWVHRDLKPANIGVIGPPKGPPLRAVLLDVGTSVHLEAGATIQPTPGGGGTLGYIAPERELEYYDRSVDIWAMGVIGYELCYGRHPWKFSRNPWRGGEENEELRRVFQEHYDRAIDELTSDYESASKSPVDGYIHRALLVEMLRHDWAADNHARRININEVLDHPNWGPLLPKQPRIKRERR
ncbi:kinase-like domain-containing protein [Xylaria venustula]|nr:kinase-like domain-containing protein [Xylaria venustula]